MLKRFWAILRARMIEYSRDKSALMWSFIFPFILICGFALMFSGGGDAMYKVGILAQTESIENQSAFLATKHIHFIDYKDFDKAQLKLSQHSLDLLIDFSAQKYWINEQSPKGYIVEQLLLAKEAQLERHIHNGAQIRYLDWVVPGILTMNMMFGSFFGVGYAIVRYRKNSVLKRLHATPLNALEFLMAQAVSRLLIVLVTLSCVFALCNLLFDFYMIGSYLNLLAIAMLGALSMICMALVISARTESEEGTNGLLNILTWPMMMLSGTWFSLEGAPQWLQDASLILPLTHVLQAARDVMFNGASLLDIADHIMALVVMTIVFTVICATRFRWLGDSR